MQIDLCLVEISSSSWCLTFLHCHLVFVGCFHPCCLATFLVWCWKPWRRDAPSEARILPLAIDTTLIWICTLITKPWWDIIWIINSDKSRIVTTLSMSRIDKHLWIFGDASDGWIWYVQYDLWNMYFHQLIKIRLTRTKSSSHIDWCHCYDLVDDW